MVYQRQPEKLTGNQLNSRAAVTFERSGETEVIFGSIWFNAEINTDTDSDSAIIHDIAMTDIRWPDAIDENRQHFTEILQAAIPDTGFEISLEHWPAGLVATDGKPNWQALIR